MSCVGPGFGRSTKTVNARVREFLDTNVLAYGFDRQSPRKRAISQEIQRSGHFVVSGQVLGELYITLTRKLIDKVPVTVAAQAIEALRPYETVPITASLVTAAIDTSVRHQLAYGDALLVEAAAAAGCGLLLTEDLTDGQVIKGVRLENPFKNL